MPTPGEHKTVQARILEYASTIGWTFVPHEEADGSAGFDGKPSQRRGLREGHKFFLAVVAGLEEGYDTVVKIFPNPLRTLEFEPSTSVTLAGITGRKSALEVRFPSPAAKAPGDEGAE